MRVLAVSGHLDRPEAHLLRGLAERGHEITVLLEPLSPFRDQLGSKVIQIDQTVRHRFDLAAAWRIRGELKRCRADILHCFNSRGLSIGLMAALRQPVAVVAYRGTVGNISRLDPAAWFTYLSPRLDSVICVSEAVRSYLLRIGLPPARVVRIYKGHDPAWYRSSRSRADRRREIGLGDKTFVVGCVANMRELKGVDLLIDAVRALPPALDVRLLLIGEVRDPQIRALQHDPAVMQRVIFTGYRRDATELIGACDLCCQPSRRREGLPKSVIEAMCQGVPAVVSNVGGMPELVLDGECGFVVPADRSDVLSAAIERLYHAPAMLARFSAAARARIANEFSIDKTIAETEALYQSLRSSSRFTSAGSAIQTLV